MPTLVRSQVQPTPTPRAQSTLGALRSSGSIAFELTVDRWRDSAVHASLSMPRTTELGVRDVACLSTGGQRDLGPRVGVLHQVSRRQGEEDVVTLDAEVLP